METNIILGVLTAVVIFLYGLYELKKGKGK